MWRGTRPRGAASGLRSLLACAALGLALACATARTEPGESAARSVVLVTFEGLRADAVGALGGDPGLTPAFDALARDSAWAGTAIAPSSDPRAALTSLLTGLRPWQHQVLAPSRSGLSPAVPTLASRLKQRGYRTTAYLAGDTVQQVRGLDRGFDDVLRFADGSAAAGHLARLGADPELVWIHLRLPATPYLRRGSLAGRSLPASSYDLPERVRGRYLERFFDPAVALPRRDREAFHTLYLHNVAAADLTLERLVRALAEATVGGDVLLAAVGVHGQEFGEYRQVAQGGNLGRVAIEVPLFLRLPAALAATGGARDSRPESRRIVPTLLELAAGAPSPPGLGASLFAATSAGAVSELYAAGGLTEISLVDGDLQLRREVRFALDGDYFAARRVLAGWPEEPAPAPPEEVFPPLTEAFENLPAWTGGGGRTKNLLYRWTDDGAEALSDPALAARMEARLAVLWDCHTVGNRRPATALSRLESRAESASF